MGFSYRRIPAQQVETHAAVRHPVDDGCRDTECPEDVGLSNDAVAVRYRNDCNRVGVISRNLGSKKLVYFALKESDIVFVDLCVNAIDPEVKAAVQSFGFHDPLHMDRLPFDLGTVFLLLRVVWDQASHRDIGHRRIASSSSAVSVSTRVLGCFKNFDGQVTDSSSTTDLMMNSQRLFLWHSAA